MKNCIYYLDSNINLKFNKQEHVIPAGLGGITKLDKGMVSDEANEVFSKKELRALRESFIAVNRMNLGPGKRGNLNFNKIKNPKMRVLQQVDKNHDIEFLLGFIYAGNSYIIPQLILSFDDDEGTVKPNFTASPFHEDNINEFPLGFNKRLKSFLKFHNNNFTLIEMPFQTNSHFINVGFYKGKWYAATSHKIINMDILAKEFLPMVEDMIENQIVYKQGIDMPNYKPNFRYTETLNTASDVFYFLYVKTALNALALFKGYEFVSRNIFDSIRKAIITQENLTDFINKKKVIINKNIINYIYSFPDKSHYIIINAKGNRVEAYVSFYGEYPAMIQLTNQYVGEPFIDGLICDWKNRDEFRLEF